MPQLFSRRIQVNRRTMKICEIFYSIQGESTFSGFPCIFVRTSGCNLRCTYCDTKFAYEEGSEMTVNEIIERIKQYNCRMLEITGGEPLLQEDVYKLIERALKKKYKVLLETNGSLRINKLPVQVIKILDVKCPGSGQSDLMDFENLSYLNKEDQIKFVLSDRADYDWAKEIMLADNLINRVNVLLSPVFGSLELKKLAEWILADNLDVRFQIQLHKIIWDPCMRGV